MIYGMLDYNPDLGCDALPYEVRIALRGV